MSYPVLAFRIPQRAKHYNSPGSLAMYLSQFAHQRFLQDRISYEQYQQFQQLAYAIFPPKKR